MGKRKGDAGGSRGGDTISWPLSRHSIQVMAELFEKGGKLDTSLACKILEEACAVVTRQPTVVDVVVPQGKGGSVSVVGDTHGHLQDVLCIFRNFGLPTRDRKYVFNGDYVDRGEQGCEVVLLLAGWMLCDASSVLMLRGNHEDRTITGMYGFAEEARKKYGNVVYNKFVDLFSGLPLAAVVGERVLVLHGGLFRDPSSSTAALAPMSSLRDVTAEERAAFDSVPQTGIVADVLWSDPAPHDAPPTSLDDNSNRGSGCHFGDDVASAWLDAEGFDLLVRGHEGPDLQDLSEGYALRADGRIATVFSARNYLGRHDNMGSIAVFGRDLHPKFATF